MKRATLSHTTGRARIVIVTPTAGSCQAVIPLTVAALIVWFLSCIPAQALGVVVFSRVVSFRRWLRGWREDLGIMWATSIRCLTGGQWKEDLELMWAALCMTARLEFA